MENELVEQARSGDHEAFSVLVRAATPRLFAVARLILRDPERAEDAVQEVFVLAWRHVHALRDSGSWNAWLYRLTVRACTRSARANRRRDIVELHAIGSREPADRTDFATRLADRDRLSRALDRLPVDQRSVMVLRFYLDLPEADIADILGVPAGTVKSRLHRGLATMRMRLAPDQISDASARERPA
jgi:RNA polymerase sigma-70 factor (ECF subfamily)